MNHELPKGLSDRPAVIRTKRHPGIDYDNILVSLINAVIEPGDTQYARVKSTYMRGGSPAVVFQVTDTDRIVFVAGAACSRKWATPKWCYQIAP